MLRTVINVIPVNLTRIPKLNYHQVKGMDDPALYRSNNEMQRKFSSAALEEFSSKMKWKKRQARILDVGSGDGGFTSEVLKSYVPRNFEKLIGVDVSPEMVMHANQHHKEDRIEFKVLDIGGSTADMEEQFDHVFSFYTLHWIKVEGKALSNIYSMLVPGGDCVFVVLCYHPFFDVYRVMATKPAWSQYIHDVEDYIGAYHDSRKPDEEFRQLMSECGFIDVDVRRKDCIFDYGDLDSMKSMATSVNPFVRRMSPDVRESFLHDYMKEIRMKIDGVFDARINKKIGKHEVGFTVLYVYGAK